MRVPIPEDYDGSAISVAGTMDHDYGEADVNLDDVDHARDITVPDDADSVGVSEHYAEAVAAYLDVDLPEDEAEAEDAEVNQLDGSDDLEALVNDGICPWCPEDDRYEGDGLPQHASSAHPEEWAAYSED